MECVENLRNIALCKDTEKKGTIIVIEALRERGYVGQWRNVSATRFVLPQRRPRVGALVLRVSKGLGPKAIREHEGELGQAFDFISKSHPMSHEALNRILDRYPLPYAEGPTTPAKRGNGQA